MPDTRTAVVALRAQGLVYREIAARLGISKAYAARLGAQAETRALLDRLRADAEEKPPA